MVRLPEIVGDVWFNSKPLKPADLAGKVVLADFWTYSCVNCLRALPYLRDLWARYEDKPFVLIGIHSPEFAFEKDPKNVERAVKELKVTWPVVLDSDYVNWKNFANHYWPAKYLADKDGKIVYTHFGEGAYAETERAIVRLLEADMGAAAPEIPEEVHKHGAVCFIATPELYCGYDRGLLSNLDGYTAGHEALYRRPLHMADDSIGLAGRFLAMVEYVQAEEPGANLLLRFRATEVNLVMRPGDGPVTVRVRLNDEVPGSQVRGGDVDAAGLVTVNEGRMYNLLWSGDLMEGVLGIEAVTGRFQAYAFTFSGCRERVPVLK